MSVDQRGRGANLTVAAALLAGWLCVSAIAAAFFVFPSLGHADAFEDFFAAFISLNICIGSPLYALALAIALKRDTIATLRPDRCHRCGYDLRGNASGVCSECGKPLTAMQRWLAARRANGS